MKKQTASCSASTTTMAIFFAQNFTKIHLGDCRLPGRTRWRGLGDRRFVHHHSKCLLHCRLMLIATSSGAASLHRLKFRTRAPSFIGAGSRRHGPSGFRAGGLTWTKVWGQPYLSALLR